MEALVESGRRRAVISGGQDRAPAEGQASTRTPGATRPGGRRLRHAGGRHAHRRRHRGQRPYSHPRRERPADRHGQDRRDRSVQIRIGDADQRERRRRQRPGADHVRSQTEGNHRRWYRQEHVAGRRRGDHADLHGRLQQSRGRLRPEHLQCQRQTSSGHRWRRRQQRHDELDRWGRATTPDRRSFHRVRRDEGSGQQSEADTCSV